MSWLKILDALIIVLRWSKKALKDGKITFKEALSLALQLAELLNLKADFNLHTDYRRPNGTNVFNDENER